MELINEPLPGALELHTKAFTDQRGAFSETFSRRRMAELRVDLDFVKDNESVSIAAGTVRGLHQ